MNCEEILINWLKENGYTGIYGDGCGCTLDDLRPCGLTGGRCEPGYKILPGDPSWKDEWTREGYSVFVTDEKPADPEMEQALLEEAVGLGEYMNKKDLPFGHTMWTCGIDECNMTNFGNVCTKCGRMKP